MNTPEPSETPKTPPIDPLDQYARNVVGEMLQLCSADPKAFRKYFIGAILANVVGNIPDEPWAQFIDNTPCGRAGCDCHLQGIGLLKELNALREDHRKFCEGQVVE